MDHDNHFKQLIRANLEAVLRIFFPAFAAQVDWERGIEFLEREHFTDLPGGNRRFIDLGAKVFLRDGRPALIHHEFQLREGEVCQGEKMPARVRIYQNVLELRYRLPVVTIVLYLFGSRTGLGWERYRVHFRGMSEVFTRYRVVGLPRIPARKGLRSGRSVGAALAALMDRGEWSRARLKAECLRAVARTPDNEALKYLATNTIETYLPLDENEEAEYRSLVKEDDYMEAWEVEQSWADRMEEKGRLKGFEQGLEKGIEKGIEKGTRRLIFRQLEARFGPLPERAVKALKRMRNGALEALSLRILEADSLDELGLG